MSILRSHSCEERMQEKPSKRPLGTWGLLSHVQLLGTNTPPQSPPSQGRELLLKRSCSTRPGCVGSHAVGPSYRNPA